MTIFWTGSLTFNISRLRNRVCHCFRGRTPLNDQKQRLLFTFIYGNENRRTILMIDGRSSEETTNMSRTQLSPRSPRSITLICRQGNCHSCAPSILSLSTIQPDVAVRQPHEMVQDVDNLRPEIVLCSELSSVV